MAVEFAEDRETDDNAVPGIAKDSAPSDTNEPKDANADSPNHGQVADDEELLKQKNPLGYTVTEPTEEEIDGQT